MLINGSRMLLCCALEQPAGAPLMVWPLQSEVTIVWAAAGYDEHGQVKTAFGKFQVAYDPVS